MANYNTFVVIDYKKHKNLLVTSSARKANKLFKTGVKIEVWNENELVEVIYFAKSKYSKDYIWRYILKEKEYIGNKQKQAEERNKRRKRHAL